MRKAALFAATLAVSGVVTGASPAVKGEPAAATPPAKKERLVECRGTTLKKGTTLKGKDTNQRDEPYQQVFRINDEYVHPEGWVADFKLPLTGQDAEKATYLLEEKRSDGTTKSYELTLLKATGRFHYVEWWQSGLGSDRLDVTDGDCKKFAPSNVFE